MTSISEKRFTCAHWYFSPTKKINLATNREQTQAEFAPPGLSCNTFLNEFS
jgi:hypothetical protein